MSSKPNNIAEQNLIFAGLGLQLGILSKDKVIRAFTEWLFDKSVPIGQILVQQKAITQEQRNTLESAVKAHVQQEGDQEKALASLHMVKDLESDLDHLADKDLIGTLDAAVTKRKDLGLEYQFTQTYGAKSKDSGFTFDGPSSHIKDRFERQQFLDSGNLGEVYFAKDTELNRLVVAKYIKPDRADESLTKALFHLEGEVTGALEHPNIVPVYGLGKDLKGRLYYAMRYIRGRKLTHVIRDYHKITKSESSKKHESLIGLLLYFQSACLAIEYAHSKGVLHCDIKPDNIMIGDYGEVFVVDWGLVVVQGKVEGSSDIYQMKTLEPGVIPPYKPSEDASSGLHEQQGGSRKGVGGTPAYMAPEQFKATMEDNISLVTAKADIYALGSTLYHLITGRAPHLPKGDGKESPDAFFFRITTGMIPKAREINPEVSNSLQGIVLKAMEVSPENRYASARELAEDIKRWVADEPVSVYQENLVEKGSRFARNNKALLTATALVLVFTSVVAFGYGIVTQGFNEQLKVSEKIAVDEKIKAEKNEQIAKESQLKAEANEKIAKEQKEKANQQLYINKIQRSNTEWFHGNPGITHEQLASIPFQKRGWEHDFLSTLSNSGQVTLKDHKNPVTSVSFSSDGKSIVSGSLDNTLKIWDASSGKAILTLNGHAGWVNSVSFSSDGKRIVSGSLDKTLKLWDATSGQEILTLKGHTNGVYSASFSPDGKRIVSGSWDNTLKIWDAINGKEILTLKGHSGRVNSASFSPDGKRIVSGSWDNTLKIWDAINGKETLTLKRHTNQVTSAYFSPDGKRIASGSRDKILKIWDAITGREIFNLKGHTEGVTSVSFSPDGKRIVSGSWDNTLKIWDTTSGQEIHTLKGHIGWVNSVNFCPDGKRIISGSLDKTLKIWDATAGQEILNLKNHTGRITSVSFSPDGKRIVSGSEDNTLKIWDVVNGQEILTLKGHRNKVTSVSFSSDGKRIVSGSEDRNLKIWDVTNSKEILTCKGHINGVNSVNFSPDGKKIVSGSQDRNLKIWDAITGREILTLKGHKNPVTSVRFSPDGKRIVSGSWDNTLKIWDAITVREIFNLKGHTEGVTSVSFSPDGNRIVSGSHDKTLKIWDVFNGQEILTLKGHTGRVNSVSFSRDGKRIVSGSLDNTLKIWDVFNGQEILTLKGHTNGVYNVSFSPDGKRIVSGSQDNTLKIWDATSGLEFFVFKGHKSSVNSASFTSNEKNIISGSLDNTLKIWDTESGAEIQVNEIELKNYKSISTSSMSTDKVWSVEVNGTDLILFKNKLREERILGDKALLTKWAQPDSNWHTKNAEDSEKNKQWFAVAFHLRKLIEIEPSNEEAKKRLQVAELNLKEGK